MSEYLEKAFELHRKGYNCAQAVLCAFADKTDVDDVTLYKFAEGLGAGMGNRKNTCGALSGAVALCGLVSSSGDINNSTKTETYKTTAKIVDEFEKCCEAFSCSEIKGSRVGSPTVSCNDCIKTAVEAVEKILFS